MKFLSNLINKERIKIDKKKLYIRKMFLKFR